uniref:Uncharacterized protein n=1 Tax=Timema douglasi TaxID=61478 RepID=A0A7R8VLU9_TIMDO|nr:unnamed protein product [Timema douglasi]
MIGPGRKPPHELTRGGGSEMGWTLCGGEFNCRRVMALADWWGPGPAGPGFTNVGDSSLNNLTLKPCPILADNGKSKLRSGCEGRLKGNSFASQINDIICPEHDPRVYSILIPHPSDCTKYYECSNGVSVLENCPPGLEFNPILFVCDWPNRAGCVHGCAPLIVENGSSWEPTSCVSGKSEFGAECSIQCASGYERSDIVTIQCTTNGWNSTNGTDVIPHCKHTQGCAPLSIVEGSSWTPTSCVYGKNDIGTECSIQCDADYERSGSNTIQCTGDGWNSTDGIDFIPSCKQTPGCTPLNIVEGSSWIPTSCVNGKNDIGTECSIQCADGYERSGSVSIQCTGDGWNSTDGIDFIPSCKQTKGCAPLNIDESRSWAPASCGNSKSDIGTECSIQCADGYESSGSVTIQCTTDGWNSTDGLEVIPSCKHTQGCAPLNFDEGSSWAPTSCVSGKNDIGTECSIQCADDYEWSGSVTIQCTNEGWNSTDGIDVIPSCKHTQGCVPLNVEVCSSWAPTSCASGNSDIGTVCSIHCVDGYERCGSVNVQCTAYGWNSTDGLNVIPSCKYIQGCDPLNVEEGSLWIPTSCANGYNEIGTECSIQCVDGYERSGSDSIQCTADGWNSTSGLNVMPTCNHIQGCAPLNVEEGSLWIPTSCANGYNEIGTECSIQCVDGYERSGSDSIQCTADGWNSTSGLNVMPTCNHIQGCAPLNVEEGSLWIPTSCANGYNEIGTECSIQCVDGYERSGSDSIQCTADGWNSTSGLNVMPTCNHIQGCAPLNVEEGSLWIPTSCANGYNEIGTECSIQCVDGYERSGSDSIQCTADGWNSTSGLNVMPTCNHIQGCAPLNVEEGSLWIPTSCANGYNEIGTECSIQCVDGYERSSSDSIQCTADGWNSTSGLNVMPTCNHIQATSEQSALTSTQKTAKELVTLKSKVQLMDGIELLDSGLDFIPSRNNIQGCAPLNVEEGSFWAPASCVNSISDIGTECSIQCDDGYERSDSVSIQCTTEGWNSTSGIAILPSCKHIPGCAPLNIKNGSSWAPTSCVNGYNDYGTECTIECAGGYERKGSFSIQCTTEGWNSTDGLSGIPSCELIPDNFLQSCAPLNINIGSSWAPTSCANGYNDYGTECTIECAGGYERKGSVSIQCTTDGWNSTDGLSVIPSCELIPGCAPLNINIGSSWAPTSCVNGYNDYGTECSIECAGGYERKGSVSIQCTTDGWNSTEGLSIIPSCELIPGCAPLDTNIGSSWAPTSCVNGYNDYGTECSIECAVGYERKGSVSLQCTTNGWNSTDGLSVIPSCELIPGCAPLNINIGSSWAPTSCANGYNDYGTECSIECADGYARRGSASIQCTTDGWNGTDGFKVIPSCELSPGCAPLNIKNGSSWAPTSCVNGYNDYGTECTIECAGGYERKGSVSIQCTTDGWNSTDGLSVIPSCELIPGCAPLNINIGSSWAPTSCVNGYNDYGTECSIECAGGYERKGSVSIQCTTDGWNSTEGLSVIPSCELIPGCAPLDTNIGSSWAPTSCVNGYNDYGTECSIECAVGYERKGSVSLQCTTNGWNSTDGLSVIPSCELIPGCAPLNINIGSSWAPTSCANGYNDYGTECSIECADGYARRGSASIQCTTDGWNSTDGFTVIPSCELIPGCAPLNIKNGSSWAPTTCVNGYNDYGTECTIECAGGYERKGSVSIQCTTDGWNSTDGLSVIPSCELIPGCAPLNINIGSSWAPTSCVNGYNDYGTECSIECAGGYERKGSVSIQCTTDGWNSTDGLSVIPSCELIPGCAPLNTKNDSSWSPTSCVNGYNDYGTECSIECPDGYESSEISSIQCTPDGWNSTAGLDIFPSCTLIPGCFPMIIKNGSSWSPTSCVTGYNDIGTDCTIACADGYQRSGSVSVQCTADGWNSTAGINFIPSCKSQKKQKLPDLRNYLR